MIKFGEWQPIETAPKDGTEILVYQPAFALHGIENWQIERIGVVSWGNYGWRVSNVSGWEYEDEFDYSALTHWMPLPSAPFKKEN